MSLSSNVQTLATRVATEAKSLRTLLNGNQPSLAGLNTVNKDNLVAAINEIEAAVSAASGIDDNTTGTTSTWSSSRIAAAIDAEVAELVDNAPGTLDTLRELSQALGDDPNFATTISTQIANRVRFDTSQTLNGTQQTTARSNIGAASAAALSTLTTNVGDTEADFVAVFNAGLT